jgi:DNA-binding IclR family transcriptional regulator
VTPFVRGVLAAVPSERSESVERVAQAAGVDREAAVGALSSLKRRGFVRRFGDDWTRTPTGDRAVTVTEREVAA